MANLSTLALEVVRFGLLYSLWLSGFIVLSYMQDSRLWLHDYPKEMQALVPPKTDAEKKRMLLWALPVTGVMVFGPFLFALWRHSVYDFSYFDAALAMWSIMQVFSIVDLLILDWWITVWWRPEWIQLEGAEQMRHHDNYRHHFVGFLKGLVFATIASAVLAIPFVWL
ncbi:MAG: hypothetical protein AAGC71_14700 [Pseudomonadota bacterium]